MARRAHTSTPPKPANDIFAKARKSSNRPIGGGAAAGVADDDSKAGLLNATTLDCACARANFFLD
jgi:hypothetical protein